MAGFFQSLLSDTAKAFFGSEYLRDYQHASKTFRTNSYANSPKFKFLFHVEFKINSEVLQKVFPNLKDQNFGLLVKSVQLPKYTFSVAELNQYNRKRLVQTKIKYEPVSIAFHDDNANLIRTLWYSYYTYYYKDATQFDAILHEERAGGRGQRASMDYNKRTLYDPNLSEQNQLDWGFTAEIPQGLKIDEYGDAKPIFFRSIDIYGFNQHNFAMYSLINPLISGFEHDQYDYSQGNGTMQNQMTIQYETVKYYEGSIDGRTPDKIIKTFGRNENYDRTLSPIARPGSQQNILGQGGLVSAAGGIMQDIQSGNFLGAIQKAGAAVNTFKNPQTILKTVQNEVMAGVRNAVSGVPNSNSVIRSLPFNFPTPNVSSITGAFNSAAGSVANILKSPPTPPDTIYPI